MSKSVSYETPADFCHIRCPEYKVQKYGSPLNKRGYCARFVSDLLFTLDKEVQQEADDQRLITLAGNLSQIVSDARWDIPEKPIEYQNVFFLTGDTYDERANGCASEYRKFDLSGEFAVKTYLASDVIPDIDRQAAQKVAQMTDPS